MIRTEAEIRQVLDATYDENVTTVGPDDEDEALVVVRDTLRWVLGLDDSDVAGFIAMYVEG